MAAAATVLPGITTTVDALALLAIAVSVVVLARSWGRLPDRVALHFGLDGRPDNWGPKRVLLLLPVFAAVFALAVIFVSWLPGSARDLLMLRLVAAETAWLIAYAEWKTILVGLGKASGLGVGFIAAVILAPSLTLVVFALLSGLLPA